MSIYGKQNNGHLSIGRKKKQIFTATGRHKNENSYEYNYVSGLRAKHKYHKRSIDQIISKKNALAHDNLERVKKL